MCGVSNGLVMRRVVVVLEALHEQRNAPAPARMPSPCDELAVPSSLMHKVRVALAFAQASKLMQREWRNEAHLTNEHQADAFKFDRAHELQCNESITLITSIAIKTIEWCHC